jgi:hypothetical protein
MPLGCSDRRASAPRGRIGADLGNFSSVPFFPAASDRLNGVMINANLARYLAITLTLTLQTKDLSLARRPGMHAGLFR